VIQKIRDAIQALLLMMGSSDFSGEISVLIQFAKMAARKIKKVTDVIREINMLTQELIEIARQIKAMIDYILSLPEKTRKFLNECLQQFYKALATGIADLFAKPALGISSGDFKQLTDAFNEITNASKSLLAEVAQTLTLPAQVTGALLNPVSSSNLLQAEQQFNQFLSNNFPSAEELINQSSTPINTAQV
jgi:phage tail tape-measure protein